MTTSSTTSTIDHPDHVIEPRRHRARWAAIGAAVAVSFGAGAASLPIADAITSSGERAVYTAITPCRLADFRPATQVGPRSSTLGPNETYTVEARGAQGNCTADDLPADAVALQLNVTALGATQPTFLAISPDGSSDTSSLNPVPGEPPTPNAVTVRLAADGTFKIFNRFGNVNAVIDVTGFYTDHHHDDRYYTVTEIDDLLVGRPVSSNAAVTASGALERGSSGVAASRLYLGWYEVDFGQNIADCVYAVTTGNLTPVIDPADVPINAPRQITATLANAAPRSGNAEVLVVQISDVDGFSIDDDFFLVVSC